MEEGGILDVEVMEMYSYLSPKESDQAQRLLRIGSLIFVMFILADKFAKNLDFVGPATSWSAIGLQFVLSMVLAALGLKVLRGGGLFETGIPWSKRVKFLSGFLVLFFMIFAFRSLALANEDLEVIIKAFLMASSAAVFEEVLVRGVLFAGFLALFKSSQRPLLWAGMASSLFFGLAHFYNLTYLGLVEVSQQVFYACVFGLILSVIRVRYNHLVPVILLHFFVDFQPGIVSNQPLNPVPWAQVLLVFAPSALLAIWALYQMDQDLRSRQISKHST